jgi:hypothetical protein
MRIKAYCRDAEVAQRFAEKSVSTINYTPLGEPLRNLCVSAVKILSISDHSRL